MTFTEGSLVKFTWTSTALKFSLRIYLEDEHSYEVYKQVDNFTTKWYQRKAESSGVDQIFRCCVAFHDVTANTFIWSTGFFVQGARSSSTLSTCTRLPISTRPSMELSGLPYIGVRSSTSSSIPVQTPPAETRPSSQATYSDPNSLLKGGIAGLTMALCGTATIIAMGVVFIWARRRQHRAAQRRAEKQPMAAVDGSDSAPSTDELTASNPRTHNYTPVPHEAESRELRVEEQRECVELSSTRERPRNEDLDELIS
ncbi:hypothetical protein EK21DRAFT_106062 [Setomelanomma holmii]|uniref:Uncharacterized protein n=1 Tax=Setomelanomma holmii TaxID=210430 RepID=A0A9P4LTJ3_9PLEO|nr:hypothetical protein EK21DRAFT_106062 [Setomelanomma holmii]